MDGFSIWLVATFFFSRLNSSPDSLPAPTSPSRTTVILLPEADGKPTGIIIKAGEQELTVTEPYQGAELSGNKMDAKAFSAAEVEMLFPEVMQALPEKPSSFTLHFMANETRLTAKSIAVMEQIREEVARRTLPEVIVSGYTDRVGTEQANLQLSLNRAEAIRDILVAEGIPAGIIQVIGRGELEMEVATDDGKPEPRNRRVVITVR